MLVKPVLPISKLPFTSRFWPNAERAALTPSVTANLTVSAFIISICKPLKINQRYANNTTVSHIFKREIVAPHPLIA